MPGSWINHLQKGLYMTLRHTGDSQERAASRSGFSERSGRRIEKGKGHGLDVYGVGTGNPVCLKELAPIVTRQTGKKLDIRWGGRSYRGCEVMKIHYLDPVPPGWGPKVLLQDGIGKMIKFAHNA